MPYKRVIGLTEEKLQVTSLFPKAKGVGKKTMVKINECTRGELKKPLKLINSLMLMRSNSQTIPISFIETIVRALNGERVDWPLILHKHWIAQLQLICQDLSAKKSHVTKSMIGAHLTLLLVARGLLTIHQEAVAGIFDIPKFLEEVNLLGNKRQRGEIGETNKGTSEKIEKTQEKDIDMLPTTESYSVKIQKIGEAREIPTKIASNPRERMITPTRREHHSATMEDNRKYKRIEPVEELGSTGLAKTLIQYIQNTNKRIKDLVSGLVETTTRESLKHIKGITNMCNPEVE